MESLFYRDANIEDLPMIVEIYNSIIDFHTITADTEPVSVESRKVWFQEHLPEKRPLWMIENSDKNIVGWVSFQSFYGRPAYDITAEISIYLHQNFRGKGLGKEILRYSLEQAENFGLENILGYIFDTNEASINLFKNFGFEEWGNFPNVAIIDGKHITLKILGKKLNNKK